MGAVLGVAPLVNQLDLFGKPRVRATDPDTSRAAAANLDPQTVSARCIRYLSYIQAAGQTGMTRDELALATGVRGAEDRALSRRITDLAHAGRVYDSRRRRPGDSGRDQIVWVAARRTAA